LPAVWLAASPNGVAGMDRGQLVSYYLVSMMLAQFITCHLMWDIAFDIREGFFTSQIIRPIGFFQMNVARNFSWRVAKVLLFLPLGLLAYAMYAWHNSTAPISISVEAVIAIFLAQMLSFVAAYCMALITMWTTEFVSVLRVYYIPEMLLSGRMVPLATLPLWAQGVARWSHFRLTNSFPTEIMLRRLSTSEIRLGLLSQVLWIGFFGVCGYVLFHRGMRHYTGVGM
jgi:ABC-2 type transport system permease protein